MSYVFSHFLTKNKENYSLDFLLSHSPQSNKLKLLCTRTCPFGSSPLRLFEYSSHYSSKIIKSHSYTASLKPETNISLAGKHSKTWPTTFINSFVILSKIPGPLEYNM